MLTSALLCVSMLTGSVTVFDPHRLAVTDLKADGVEATAAATLTGLLAEALARDPRFSVRDRNDLNALLVNDKEQQLLGCNDPACYVDISRFVGAESIVTGNVGRLGKEFVLSASRIDAGTSNVVNRASAKAKSIEDLGREMPALARDLLFDRKAPPSQQGLPPSGSLVARLEGYDDCQWAVIRDVREGAPTAAETRLPYEATFTTAQFRFGKDRPLDEILELAKDVYFLGRFPSCYPRARDELSAFTVVDDQPLVVQAKKAEVVRLRDLWREGKLELRLRFEIVGGALHPAKPFDWENCPGEKVAPFKKSDISPNAKIRVLGAELRDLGRNKSFVLHRQLSDEAGDLTLEPVAKLP